MKMYKMKDNLMEVPVLTTVDVAVVGATTGAVAAALAAKDAGASVFVASDRTYFGVEFAGRLELWPHLSLEDPLLQTAFSASPLRPGDIKRGLDTALQEAEIPFLFLTRPVALLRSSAGEIAGLVLASRTSLYAVRARRIVDASEHGVVARLAGVPLEAQRTLATEATLVVLAESLPAHFPGRAETAGPAMSFPRRVQEKAQEQCLTPYRLHFPNAPHETTLAALASLESRWRAQLLDPAIAYSAHAFDWAAPFTLAGRDLKDTTDALTDLDYQAVDDLFVLGQVLPLSSRGLDQWSHPEKQISLGRRVGTAAATALPPLVKPVPNEKAGPFRVAESFVRGEHETIALALDAQALLGSYDVTVAGGGTGGAPAGISAAQAGARALVLETQHSLGGVGTLGLICTYWFGNRVGFTDAMDRSLAQLATGKNDPKRVSSWNSELKMAWYHQALKEAGGEAWQGSFAFGVRMDGKRLDGLLVSTPFGSGLVETGAVVDSTGNADVAAAAGAPCRVIGAEHAAVQGSGLSPRNPLVHYRNSDYTFIDDSDIAGVTHAFVNARAKFPADFDVSPLVNSRERRQIVGEIELSPLDFLAKRTFDDTIAKAHSNFDTHGFTVHPVFMVTPPDKKPLDAYIPFRTLLPQEVEGILVTGLGMSAHRDAIPVIRMQADVQNQGFAAGLAAACAETGNLRALDLRTLQQRLVEAGILENEVLTHRESFPLSSATLSRAVKTGPSDLFSAAVLFTNAKKITPMLLERLSSSGPATEDAALVLGLLGRAEAAPVLAALVGSRHWDEGWNYKGMGQFGLSNSRTDALIIALGRTGHSEAIAPVLEKIKTLSDPLVFSHCRAVSLATACLGAPVLGTALSQILQRPVVRGHVQLTSRESVKNANDDPVEVAARNLSLCELYLARGVFLAGDPEGLGRQILEAYTHDLRGVFARHAAGVLSASQRPSLAAMA